MGEERELAADGDDEEDDDDEDVDDGPAPSDCLGDNEATTMTDPDALGACQPGTAVKVQGIVWQETERGKKTLLFVVSLRLAV